jgi:hypothetical protein
MWRNIQLLFIDTHTHIHRFIDVDDGDNMATNEDYINICIHRKKKEHFERIDRTNVVQSTLFEYYTKCIYGESITIYVRILLIMCISFIY